MHSLPRTLPTLATLGTFVLGTGLGVLPVGRFIAPASGPPEGSGAPTSSAHAKVGPLSLDAYLSQSVLHRADDGTVFVDVKLTADNTSSDAERRPIDVAFVLDVSGSMADQNKIGLMKQACHDFAKKLSTEDRVALVAFSTAATTRYSEFGDASKTYATTPVPDVCPRDLLGRGALARAIDELVAAGGTNISSGLELGAAELMRSVRPGAARRIVLLTDGQPNAGEQMPQGLRSLCARLAQQGISVTTVGLGLDYNGELLSAMADAGGGRYHYVDAPQRIAGIYDAELRSLRSLVARDVTVTLEPMPGVELVRIVDWTSETAGRSVKVRLGDVEAARATKIVAKLRLDPRGAGTFTAAPVVRVSLDGADTQKQATLATTLPTLGVALTDSLAAARASECLDARSDVEGARVGVLVDTARSAMEHGDRAGARRALDSLRTHRTSIGYTSADGNKATMTVDDLQGALESDRYEERQRALLFSKSAASAEAR